MFGFTEKAPVDALRQLSDKLRAKNGLEWGTAKLELSSGDTHWVEYFRGKDFVRYFSGKPDLLASHVRLAAGSTEHESIEALLQLLLRRKLVTRAERKFKKAKPGKKRLVKWPRTLEASEEQGLDEEAFYAWQYNRPTSPWLYVGGVLLVLATLGACLFPLAPHWLRLWVAYGALMLLSFLLGLLAVRCLLFGLVWLATGRSFWLFPNIMSDQVGLTEAFWPIISYETPTEGGTKPVVRAAAALLLAATTYAVYSYSPDIHLREQVNKAHDSLLNFVDMYGSSQGLLGGGENATAGGVPLNVTGESGGADGAGAAAGQGKGEAMAPEDAAVADYEIEENDSEQDLGAGQEKEL